MDILVTGCERSGTKMLAEKLGKELKLPVLLENKYTVAAYRYYQELKRWKEYEFDLIPKTAPIEKHSLNLEQGLPFLEWIKEMFPDVKIHYIIRDPYAVVASMINKTWGTSTTGETYKMGVKQAVSRWNHVMGTTYKWAKNNAVIYRYEDYCTNDYSLTHNQISYIKRKVSGNLKIYPLL